MYTPNSCLIKLLNNEYELIKKQTSITKEKFKYKYSKVIFHLSEFFGQVIKGQAAVHRCSAEVGFFGNEHPTIPPTTNDERIYELVRQVSSVIVGEENVELAPFLTGSEDFAFYLEKVPGSFLLVGMRNEKSGSIYSGHSPYFAIDEGVLPIGAAIHAAFALSYHSYSTNSSFQ